MANVTSTELTPSMLLAASPNRPVVSVDPTAIETMKTCLRPPSTKLVYRSPDPLASVSSLH
jgi:hypothetical protein